MSAKTKIVVLHMKELIYTLIFSRTWNSADFFTAVHVPARKRGRRVGRDNEVCGGSVHVIDPVWRACGGYAGDCG